MSEILHLRQRIKTVRTTQKITHAMRLISMSQATRFKNQLKLYHNYSKSLDYFYSAIESCSAEAFQSNALLNPPTTGRHGIIVIGPQKGLCGNFLQAIITHVVTHADRTRLAKSDFTTIGKKTAEGITRYGFMPTQRFDNLSGSTVASIASQLTEQIMQASPSFETITVYSGTSKSFFLQLPITTHLIPLKVQKSSATDFKEPVLCDQDPDSLVTIYLSLLLKQKITTLLLNSLSAEQAARFLSMDYSIRNATQLLNEMQLSYNKLRQGRITRELTDLTGGLEREVSE